MRATNSSSIRRHGLLFVPIAVVGLVAGILMTPQTRTPEAEGTLTRESGESRAELETLQASLQRSQALPADFRQVPAFRLSDVDGEPLTESVLEGHWSLLFFGYTNCPDVCPVTLSVIRDVVEELESRGGEPPQVLFATVDPGRDTVARMKEYVAYFDEDFIGVTGERDALHELAGALGIVAAFTADEAHPEAYTVDHTASLLLVDPERRVRAKLTAPHEVATIVADYLTLRAALN